MILLKNLIEDLKVFHWFNQNLKSTFLFFIFSQLQDFLESNFLQEQVESIAELRSMLSRLQSALPGMNLEFFVDQELRR